MREKISAEELVSLGEQIAEQAVHLDAAMHRLLADLRRFDEAGGWHVQGYSSCAHWLSHRVGWDLGTSRERVRVARTLAELPKIDAALAAGQLSYSKARAITRVATPITEPVLLKYAEVSTASQLETICRKFHAAERIEADPKAALPRSEDRYVVATETASGMVCVKAVLRADEAALLMQVIQRAAADCVSDAEEGAAEVPGENEKEAGTSNKKESSVRSDAESNLRNAGRTGSEAPAGVPAEASAVTASTLPWRTPRTHNRVNGLMALAQAYARGENPHRSPIELIVTTSAEMLRAQDRRTIAPSPSASPAPSPSTPLDPSPSASLDPTPPTSPVPSSLDAHPESPPHGAPCACPTDRGASIPATAVAETNLYLSPDATRLLACDCGLVEATVDAQGEPLSIGRKTRTIPAAIKRALLLRDRACRFPGCDHRLFLDGHHIRHWADGGETSLLNTCLLCTAHHAYVHMDGYRISRDEQGALIFFDPRGKIVVATPPRPSPPQLGWPAIRTANATLDLTSESLTPKGRGGPLDVGEAVGRLLRTQQSAEVAPPTGAPPFHAMPTAKPASQTGRRAAPRRAALAPRPPVAEDEYEEEDEAQLAHDFWAGGQRVDELLEWSMAELLATGIDPMAQVPAPYCAPAGWRSTRPQPQQ